MSQTFQHPTLGGVTGIGSDKALSYLGIQYATLASPLADAQLPVYAPGNKISATAYGPSAISLPNGCDMEHVFIQQALPHGEFSFSDTECLSLNIFLPKTTQKHLPVFTFVHGGGFFIGSNSWPQYSLAAFVEKSVDCGMPVIGINIKATAALTDRGYRLGLSGFLTSQELRDAGYKPNNGLRDQLVAFEWIKKHIAGFGGNPDDITAAGESAGAVALLHHANSTTPPFSRVVSMAGTPLLAKPLPLSTAESTYFEVIKELGIGGSSPQERIKALLSTSAEDVLGKISPSLPFVPVVDGDIVRNPVTFSGFRTDSAGSIPLMIGDCGFDSSILWYMLSARLPMLVSDFHESLTKSLADIPHIKTQLLMSYNITTDPSPENVKHIFEFAHDIGFFAPVLEIARSWPQKCHVFHINATNPWDGPWKDTSTHIFDVVLLLRNYESMLPQPLQETSDRFCEDMLKFVTGEEPFPAFEVGNKGAQVYDSGRDGCRYVTGAKSESYGRRSNILDLSAETGFDRLSTAWGTFMAGN